MSYNSSRHKINKTLTRVEQNKNKVENLERATIKSIRINWMHGINKYETEWISINEKPE
jgi:hypothetical protein